MKLKEALKNVRDFCLRGNYAQLVHDATAAPDDGWDCFEHASENSWNALREGDRDFNHTFYERNGNWANMKESLKCYASMQVSDCARALEAAV